MSPRETHYRWQIPLQAAPKALWPLLADTDRFNQLVGAPALHPQAQLENGRRRVRIRAGAMSLNYVEHPFEWSYPHRFGVVREFEGGPMEQLRMRAALTAGEEGGELLYEVWLRPRGLLGRVVGRLQFELFNRPRVGRALRGLDALAAQGAPLLPLLQVGQVPRFAPGGRDRLAAAARALLEGGAAPQLVDELCHVIERADAAAAARLRPFELADAWGAGRTEVLTLCLQATRAGALELSWDLLCPLCRGATQRSGSLHDVQGEVHCDACQIDFSVNFERSVEVSFRVNPMIRLAEEQTFCLGGPGRTPHVVAQQLLAPGEEREADVTLEPGRYRLRTLGRRGGRFFHAESGGPARVVLGATGGSWPEGEDRVGTRAALRFVNSCPEEQLFIFERLNWRDDAATAADVTSLQIFRDLFSREALRPDQQISVGSLAILFTDLLGSTQLYNEIGDAPAFGTVMNHFTVLRRAIDEEGGALVKTIGDAVMAVFRDPAGAVRAALRAQAELAAPVVEGVRPLHLRAGIHLGPCIAVTLNDRLDYFGSTINLAARLEGLSSGSDVVVSDPVRRDPRVEELLGGEGALTAEPFEAPLKGFDEARFSLFRLAKGAIARRGQD